VQLVDTHCHIHEANYQLQGDDPVRARWLKAGIKDPDTLIKGAQDAGVTRLICVGTSLEDSQRAVDFVQDHSNCWAAIGIHPHEAKLYAGKPDPLGQFAALAKRPKVVAVGECGLDYYYGHSPKGAQAELLHFQLQVAQEHGLPLIFHVRDAFDDFWPILDQYKGVQGVVHSFSATTKELEDALARGLYVGLNGIMTFTKDPAQLAAAKRVPLDRLLLETDAPFLTPTPYRGTICEPKHARVTAEFLSALREETLEQFAVATTQNATKLFKLHG
jgi:TatD DNase family protein